MGQLCAHCDELSGFTSTGENFMLIADGINHFRTCAVSLLAAFLSDKHKNRVCAFAHA
jgi:hypothetical protein